MDCTSRVADVRTLRAAAFVPFVLALTLLVVAVPLSYDSGERAQAAQFFAVSMALFLDAGLIKRGSISGTLVLAVCLAAASILTVAGFVLERRTADTVPELLGSLSILALLCWLSFRAVAASRRLKRVPWRPPTAASIRGTIRQLPRDRRLIRALAPLAASLAVYGCGLQVAVVVGLATRHALLAGLALLPFALAGGRLLQRARRTLAQRAAEVRAADTRRPLLLLRSFADDHLELERRFEYFGTLFRRRLTLEEFIVQHLAALGPVVAIGKPSEGLSPLGAAREYVFGEGWQQRVSEVLEECSWVVSILGTGKGLHWEYGEVLRRGMTDRFLLVVPPAPASVIRPRWDAFRAVFPPAAAVELPLEGKRSPLYAAFPRGAAPLLLASRYQNETAYSVAFVALRDAMVLA